MNDVRTVRVIWFALMMTLVIYAIICFTVLRPATTAPLEETFRNPIVIALHVVAIADLLMSFIMPRNILRRNASAPRAPQYPSVDPVVTPAIRTAMILRWALIECVAIFGLLAAFMVHDSRVFLPLLAVSAAAMLMAYPSDNALRDAAAPA